MEAKEFFARMISNDDMQAVINCNPLPEIEVKEQEVRQAYRSLPALQRCVVKKRMRRYHSAFSGIQKPEIRRQFAMLTQILQIIV